MNPLAPLLDLAGAWSGSNRLHDPFTRVPDDSPSALLITSVLGGRFVRLDYDWAYLGAPQEGSLLVGFEADGDVVTAQWVDTWHVGDRVMTFRGTGDVYGILDVRASYAAPSGPDWGWRVQIVPGEDVICLIMHNVTPDGVETLAVESSYTRT